MVDSDHLILDRMTCRKIATFSLFATLFGTLLISGSQGFEARAGDVEHGEDCDPSPSQTNEALLCDGSKRLSCDPKAKTCKCHHEERDSYNEKKARCETKVGKGCGASSEKFPIFCVEHAECNKTSNFCECSEGYEKNEDGTKCRANGRGGVSPGQEQNFYLNGFYFMILLISVFVCN